MARQCHGLLAVLVALHASTIAPAQAFEAAESKATAVQATTAAARTTLSAVPSLTPTGRPPHHHTHLIHHHQHASRPPPNPPAPPPSAEALEALRLEQIARCKMLNVTGMPLLKATDLLGGSGVLVVKEGVSTCDWNKVTPGDLTNYTHLAMWKIEASKGQRFFSTQVCAQAHTGWQPIVRLYKDDGTCLMNFQKTLTDSGTMLGGGYCPHARGGGSYDLLHPNRTYFLVITGDISTGAETCGPTAYDVIARTSLVPSVTKT